MAKKFDWTRPDKLFRMGLGLVSSGQGLYSSQKAKAKAKAELTFIGEKKIEKVSRQLYQYSEKHHSKEVENIDLSILKKGTEENLSWLNYYGIHDVKAIEEVANIAQLDRLTIRQILDTTQRPKVEDYPHYLFLSVKSIEKDELGGLKMEQLSFVLGKHYIISFQEALGDHCNDIRHKMQEAIGFIRKRPIDYLLTQLLDAILDNYFETIEKVNQDLAIIEHRLRSDPDKELLILLENHKKSVQLVKKALGPFREALGSILNGHSAMIRDENMRFFRELSTLVTAAIEEVDTSLRTIEGLTNIYFSALSQKMNETMKVLTTVATIFIPLTFIAGIYGMNFVYMPELQYRYGYHFVWVGMVVIALVMLVYFKRKKWL